VLKNHNQGDSSSADIVAVANNGDDGNFYIDMGMNSNVYANASYAVTRANDGYLYVNGGNLVIGTQTAGKVINFFTGGTDNLNKVRGTISDTGLSMVGNITGGNVISTNATIGGTMSATGNITGGNVLTGGQISATGNLSALNVNTGIVSATGNIVGGNLNIPSGLISVSGNITGGNLLIPTGVANIGNITTANIVAGNITSAIISATGNISGPNIVATILSVSAALNVTGNINGGNLLTSGLISTTGNVTANYFFGDGGQLSNITAVQAAKIANGTSQINIPIASSNAFITIGGVSNVAVFSTTGEYITGLLSVSGNVTGGNVLTSGLVSATGTVTGSSFLGTVVSVTANVTGGNVLTGGLVSATGTVTGSSHLGAVVSVTANITGGNVLTGGVVSSTGNGIHGNLVGQNLTSGRVAIVGSGKEVTDDAEFTYNASTNVLSVAGNISAANFIGNIISANNISNVGNVFVQGNIQYNLATDDGGNVTQLTNKATAVTCNGRTGRITMSGAALTGGDIVTFTVNNTYVQQYDLIILNMKDPIRANTYVSTVAGVGVNNFNVQIQNADNNSHSDAIVLSFAVIQVR
jgi:hypothetical protein